MQDQLRATKLWLQKQFKTSGIQLDPAALEELVRAVQDVPDPEEYVHSLIEEIETGGRARWGGWPDGRRVAVGSRRRQLGQAASPHLPLQCSFMPSVAAAHTRIPYSSAPPCGTSSAAAATDARRVTRPLLEAALGALEGRSQPQDVVQVVDAFQMPNIAYDPVRKVFHRSSAQPHLQADGKVRAVCCARGRCMTKGWPCEGSKPA